MNRFLLIAVLTLLASCASLAQNQSEDVRRLTVVKEYASAAKLVADTTQDPSAQYLYNKVVSQLHPLRITSNALEKIPTLGAPNNMPIGIIALLQSDYKKKDLPPLFKQHLEPNAKIGGSFIDVAQMIIVTENSCSSLVKGMIILHEAGHAATFLEKKVPPRKESEPDVIEETQVHMFEERLWRLIGGQTYEKLIIKEVARLRADFKKDGFKGFQEIQKKGGATGFNLRSFVAYPELKTLVVPSSGGQDMEARQGALVQSALFRIIDQDVPNVDHRADLTKASLIQYLHRAFGMYH